MGANGTLGVDLGTTTIKAIVFDERRQVVARAVRPVVTTAPEPGDAEQDPAAIYDAAVAAMAEAALEARRLGCAVARVGLSAGMHSIIAVDDAGAPLTPALVWIDNRAAEVADRLWRSPDGPALYAATGAPIHAMLPLAKLLWWRQHRPAIVAQAAHFVSLKEYVWWRWFGAWEVDPGIAVASGLAQIDGAAWDAGALRLCGLAATQLSAIVPATHVRAGPAETRLRAAGLAAAPFAIGSSDGVLAQLAAGALAPGTLTVTIGTSSAVRAGTAVPRTDPAIRAFCYPLTAGRYVVGLPSNSGGSTVEWVGRLLLGADHPPEALADLIAAAGDVTGDVPLCLPYIAGERAPLWDGDVAGTLHGLRSHHRAPHVMRAAIEGVAMNLRWLGEQLGAVALAPSRVVASGKVLESPWARRTLADLFGVPVAHDPQGDASALGAALVAEVATDARTWDDARTAPAVPPAALTAPQADAALAARYAAWRQLAAALHPGAGR